MFDEMTYQNAAKFAVFLEYEKPKFVFVFHFVQPAFIRVKNKVAQNEKRKNYMVFVFQKYGQF